jgi:hypothetical protein
MRPVLKGKSKVMMKLVAVMIDKVLNVRQSTAYYSQLLSLKKSWKVLLQVFDFKLLFRGEQ